MAPRAVAGSAVTWLSLLLVAGGVAGCAKPEGILCPTGIFCPPGSQCAVAAPKCIWTSCGNGKVDPGEACDNGKVQDGTGCSADCRSNEACGNGITDTKAGEQCDYRDPVWVGRCSDSCVPFACGNGVVDSAAGEQCDGGAANGLHADCLPTCLLNVCGDGYVNETLAADGLPKETCDDGPASATYQAECPYTRDSATPCQLCSQCRLETRPARYCGDGVVDGADGEACDDARSFACGTCGAPGGGGTSCRVVASADATGTLTLVSTVPSDLDGVTFTLRPSVYAAATVFELVNGGSAHPGHVTVDVGGASGGPAIAAAIRDAIEAQTALGITAAHGSGSLTVSLTNAAAAGVSGNAAIAVSDTAKLRRTGMASGLGCALGQQCASGADCVASLSCISGFCQ
jgi:cysteine-rich repeat protein